MYKYLIAIALILVSFGCREEGGNVIGNENENEVDYTIEKLTGFVQKGPFLNGTSITISDLTKKLVPTGKNYNSQIIDNSGTFEILNVNLRSGLVEIKAEGFYFDEANNENSDTQLTLYGLSDLSDKNSLNVNVLSSLEKGRVAYLVSEGAGFIEAKVQAQREILTIFNITRETMSESELLDISKSGEDNAILLALSVILQGHLSVADLSELLANISTDIRLDGILDSQTLGSKLLKNAKGLNTSAIRYYIEHRYEELGMTVEIPDFEKYVDNFIESSDFVVTSDIEYPESGLYGLNILDLDKTEFVPGEYSMCVNLPEGNTVKITMKGKFWFFSPTQDLSGWIVSDWDVQDNSRTLTSKATGELDFRLTLKPTGGSYIRVYIYENGDVDPTYFKLVSVK